MRLPFISRYVDKKHAADLTRDLAVIVLSILVAVILVETGTVHKFLNFFGPWHYLGSFIAGFFFTSMFTTAPAIAVLSDLTYQYNIWAVAFWGAVGSVIGDSIIYRFLKDDLTDDFLYLFNLASHKRWRHIFRSKLFKWLPPLLGALVIASPLPDELGMMILGLSKVNKRWFGLISFIFSFLGILFIGWISRSL